MMFLRPRLIVLLLGCVIAVPTAAMAQWTAYNDFAWVHTPNLIFGRQGGNESDPDYRTTPGDINSGLARVTLFTDGNDVTTVDTPDFYAPDLAVEAPESNGDQARSGFLRNFGTGATLPVGAAVDHTGQTFQWATVQGATTAEVPGSDAYAEFWDNGEPAIGLWGMADGNDVNSTHTVTLTDLDPNKTYEYTTFGNFGHYKNNNGGVNWRWTKIEGHDPSGFKNLSSVDTDYATAINVDAGDVSDPRHSVGHEQRAVIRSESDPSHYVSNSGEIWFDGWVTKFSFKPGADGEVDIVTKGINNAASMVFANVGNSLSTDTSGVPEWRHEDVSALGDHSEHLSTRVVENLPNGFAEPGDTGFGEHYLSGWREHTDPAQWPADPDVLEATVGQSIANGDAANSRFYLNGFKLEEFAAVVADADFNGDGDVDGSDFLTWQRNLGTGTTLLQGDANGDEAVDGDDLSAWQSQYGAAAVSAASSVPEPTSLLLVFSALFCCAPSRRRQA